MNIDIWTQRHFYENSTIKWPCPNCESQSLKLNKDKFYSEESAISNKERRENEDWDFDWIRLVFSGHLICSNCEENIFFTGRGTVENSGYYNHKVDEYIEEYSETYTPTYFQPSLKIFRIAENCPTKLREEIENSFKLFWCDLSSCANKIRISLEILLDYQKVKKYENRSGKRYPISLHKRIEIYDNSEIKELLLAIKWLGNIGSHFGEIETIDILEAYRLLEFSLNKIYNNEEKELRKITKEIIKRKGIRKRK